MAANPLLSGNGADARPRIHLWPGERVSYSLGPRHARFSTEAGTAGAAVEEALALVDHQKAVIIWEGMEG